MYMYVHVYVYVCVYVLIHVYIHARVGVHMQSCRPLLHARVSQVFLNTCMRVWGGVGSGSFSNLFVVSDCCWCERLCFGRGRDKGFVLYVFLFGKPAEPRSTKAQYTCRLYKCTQYIYLYICWAAGFDDLG